MNTGGIVKVQDPTLLTDEIMDQAYALLDSFLMDVVDELAPDITDEEYREQFIHMCYMLIYREVTTLTLLRGWEEGWKERLGTRKRGAKRGGGTYGR
jgi:hypothetical protein